MRELVPMRNDRGRKASEKRKVSFELSKKSKEAGTPFIRASAGGS